MATNALPLGVLLDPGVDDAPEPQPPVDAPPTQDAAPHPPAEPPPPAQAPAEPPAPPAAPEPPKAPSIEEQLEALRKEAEEAKRLAEFWAKKAAAPGAPAQPAAPVAPPPPPPKQYTKEEIADALTEGNTEVLADLGYIRRDDAARIAEEVSQRQFQTFQHHTTTEQRIQSEYKDYLDPQGEKFKLLQQEIQSNPIYQKFAEVDRLATLEMALSLVKARDTQAPPAINYEKRVQNQAPPSTKPAPSKTGAPSIATPSQIKLAEALGIPVADIVNEYREMRNNQ